jgi:hypothetical protein
MEASNIRAALGNNESETIFHFYFLQLYKLLIVFTNILMEFPYGALDTFSLHFLTTLFYQSFLRVKYLLLLRISTALLPDFRVIWELNN